jgi:SAM-dependent methyltransferase
MSDVLRAAAADALAEWGRRVQENRRQVDRVREVDDGPDFYGPVAARFVADPHRRDDPTLEVLRRMVGPGEHWLDVGAGGGRYALPIALIAKEVVALDVSPGMLGVLRDAAAKHGIGNVRTVQARWPVVENADYIRQKTQNRGESEATSSTPTGNDNMEGFDAALIAHVGYDVEEIGPFLNALEAAATRCVAILMEKPPASDADALWPEVHGEARATLPSLPEFLALQLARGRLCEVRLVPRGRLPDLDDEQALAMARRLTWVKPGSAKDRRLQQLVRERQLTRRNGTSPSDGAGRIGIVSWGDPSTDEGC